MQITLDEIYSIKKIGTRKTIDITVSGDNLFFANDILTHNSGVNNSDVELTDTSESMGTTMTADLIFALIRTDELDQLNQVLIKQLKNRYNDPTINRKFVLGVDRAKMKLYDAESSAQDNISESNQADEPIFEKTSFGQRSKRSGFGNFQF